MKDFFPEGRLIETDENRRALSGPAALSEAGKTGMILEQTALRCSAEHDLIVPLGDLYGIIPRAEGALGIVEGSVRDIAIISRVGKPVCFTVTRLSTGPDGPFALLSRRAAQERCLNEYVRPLRPGDVIPARVTHIEPFGAFCDIGCGISALLPIDSISVSRISHPSERFACGEDIRAVVRTNEKGRVTLSCKELLGTWEENAAAFRPGETVSGIVRSVEDYGVFVELRPNLAGLAEPRAGVTPGQQATVYIKSVIPEKMKLKLIIIDSFYKENTRMPVKYFFCGPRLTRWDYSPAACPRRVFTDFSAPIDRIK